MLKNREEKEGRKMTKYSLMWDTIKCANIHVTGVVEEKRNRGTEKIFEEIMAENISDLLEKKKNLHV